jgi:FkbM family methyltransferase
VRLTILYEFNDGPYGGGNQFLKALKGEFQRLGIYTSSLEDANVCLLNAFPTNNMGFFLKAIKRKLDDDKFVIIYRLDGLYHKNRMNNDQKYIDEICKIFANVFVDGIVYQTLWIREIQQNFGISKKTQNSVILNSPDSNIFYPKKKNCINGKTKLISTSWSNSERKGFQTYKWLDENLDFSIYEMTFIGNSPYKFENIEILPPMTSIELAEEMSNYNIFISPAFDEPCSNSLIEAIHMGLVPLAHDSGGSPEIIKLSGGRLFKKKEEIPEILFEVVENFNTFCVEGKLPKISSIANMYVDFINKVQENADKKHINKSDYKKFKTYLMKNKLIKESISFKLKKKFSYNTKVTATDYEFLFDKAIVVEDSVCIDCGANVGNVTLQMSNKGAEVYAFEPNPHAFKILSERFNNNKKVHCINKGVWDRNGKMKLFFHENSSEDEIKWSTGSSILEFKKNISTEKFIEIEVIDLIQFIRKLDKKISILKIDVEGAECEILERIIEERVYENIEKIFVETHDHKIPELKIRTDIIRKKIKEEKIENISLDWI